MTGNKYKFLAVVFAIVMSVPILSTTVLAETCQAESFSITVNMKTPDSDGVYDTPIYLYQVADAAMDNNGNLHMEPLEAYKSFVFDSLTQEDVRILLDKLCKTIKTSESKADTYPELSPLVVKQAGTDGKIHFDNLVAGVYLLMKDNKESSDKLEMSPALVYLPNYNQDGDSWEHTATVNPKFDWHADVDPNPHPVAPDTKLPQTGMVQWPVPLLVLAGLFLLLVGYGMVRNSKQD